MTTEIRTLDTIAAEIRLNWTRVNYSALPYLEAMETLKTTNDMYGCDDAKSVVAYFLCNATTWRGETAKRIKQELKDLLKK